MSPQFTLLIFGATGRTGQQFISLVLEENHKVKALVRNPQNQKLRSDEWKGYYDFGGGRQSVRT
jgi:putative NADH-flavin reductase